ncbi:ABC transporter substrate-binding protein [Microvirga zambiensis]|uniref:ABC transporter substrate-binding protein n=1 Tax=Microvirga zambiensis TaxID=1402137 RepID=UPI00191F29FE|nr:ABC transporter substrate-binding protein [Microvirga zambiensis]
MKNLISAKPPSKWSIISGALAFVLAYGQLASVGVAQPGVDEAARAALPEGIRTEGVLKVATSLQWPPFDYVGPDGKPVGLDVSLIKLIAAKLGLEPQFEDIKFPSIVPGVQSGRYHAGVNQLAITAERGKVVDFLPYFKAGFGLLVRTGSTADLKINALCGRNLAVVQGSMQMTIGEELSKRCVSEGKRELTLSVYPSTADAYLAVANGRGDGAISATAVGIYIGTTNQKLAMTKEVVPGFEVISGIALQKGNEQLRQAMRIAMERLYAEGEYQKLLAEYGVPESALSLDEIKRP